MDTPLSQSTYCTHALVRGMVRSGLHVRVQKNGACPLDTVRCHFNTVAYVYLALVLMVKIVLEDLMLVILQYISGNIGHIKVIAL